MSVEERVGACGSVGEVPGVGVEVAAGSLDRFVAKDALEDMEWDASVGEPGRSGVTEPVPGEAGQLELGDELVPLRRIPHGRCGEDATSGTGQEPLDGFTVVGEGVWCRNW